jgi:hypothetical protein
MKERRKEETGLEIDEGSLALLKQTNPGAFTISKITPTGIKFDITSVPPFIWDRRNFFNTFCRVLKK